MTDQTSHAPHLHEERPSRRSLWVEFAVYFALIFMLTLPFGVIGFFFEWITTGKLPELGPVCRARLAAREIAPMVFAA